MTSFLYVLAANATAVDVLSLGGPGQATNIQKLDISGPAHGAGLQIRKPRPFFSICCQAF